MPTFVWQSTLRGGWAPSVYHGEMPRDMQSPAVAHLYRVHEIPPGDYDAAEASNGSVLDFLSRLFPPPKPVVDDVPAEIDHAA